MKPALGLVAILLFSGISLGQNMQLRQKAISLLERADAASTSPNWPSLEGSDTFRVLDSSTGPQQGAFTRVVIQGTGRRDEISFGDYHLINVYTRAGLATVRTSNFEPPAVVDALRLTPILFVRFNGEDVIYAINNSEANGHPARCIEFNTIVGEWTEDNELCVDSANGTLVREKLGDELIENSDFFSFAGAMIPGRIR